MAVSTNLSTAVAIYTDTNALEDSSLIPRWSALVSIRWFLVDSSMPLLNFFLPLC